MKIFNKITISALALTLIATSCTKQLNTKPIDPLVTTSATIFDTPASYKQFLAKIYGSMALTGQKGQAGAAEIQAPDEGTTAFLREYWAAQEVTTDECLNAWGDGGLVEYHGGIWSDNNSYVQLMYQRLFINIAYANQYIGSVNAKLPDLTGTLKDDVTRYVAEARFLRAYFYYCAMDLYGNVPFATETNLPGTGFVPKQIARADLFKYIETELLAIIPALADPATNEYARADKASAWALLSRMYLNAQVYTGTPRYTESITYANSIINSGKYALHNNYRNLFLADNNNYRDEILLPIAEDGINTQSYGDMTFVIHAAVGGSEDAKNMFGIASGGWAGNRLTTTFVNKFADISGNTDTRAIFYSAGQTPTISNPTIFTQGYLCAKFKNVTSTGALGSNDTFVDTDFPLFRLSEVYLNYAEAVLRGGTGGDAATALSYINKIRQRAYGNTSGNITAAQMTLNFMIDERGRELYWEALRRTDLIRFGLFTGGTYLWDFKGNVQAGAATDAHLNLFPLPASDLQLNPNLKQNPGY